MRNRWMVLVLCVALAAAAPSLAAQGRWYTVTVNRAIVVTKEVLVRRGYQVVRIEQRGPVRVLWYRRGTGKLVRLIIRRVEDRIVFEETPAEILVDVDVKLRVP